MFKQLINNIVFLEIILVLLFLLNIMFPNGLFFPLLLVFSALIMIKDKASFPLLLFISSYFNWAPDIYHSSLLGGVSIIYLYSILLVFILGKIVWKTNFLILSFTLGMFISIIIGFFNKFSVFYYAIESYFFILLLYFVWYGYNLNKSNLNKVISYIQRSIVIYYPLTGIVVIFASFFYGVFEWDIISYEASKVYSIAFLPIIFFNYKQSRSTQILLIILNLVYQGLHYSYGYFGSGDAIFIAASLIFVFWFNTKPVYRIITLGVSLSLVVSVTYLITSKGSGVGAYKVNQVIKAYNSLVEGDIKVIPASPRVRVIETMNTMTELNSKPQYWLFGKGIGSYFTDKYYPFEDFDLSDSELIGAAFPEEEVEQKKFRKGHSFISYLPLKLGYFNSLLLIFISVYSFVRLRGKQYYWLRFIVLFYFIVLGFGVKNYIFIGLFIGISLNIINQGKFNKEDNTLKESDLD